MSLGNEIKQLRKKLKLTQEEFGNLFDPPASKGIVSKWESNKTIPSKDRLADISNWSRKPVDELLYGSLRGAIINIINDADSYLFSFLDIPNVEKFISSNSKRTDIETVSYLRSVHSYLMFITNDNYGTPYPKTSEYKNSKEYQKVLQKFYDDEFIAARKYLLNKTLEIAKATGIKPYQRNALMVLVSNEAERHFNHYTRDNDGLINIVKNGLEQVLQNIYNLKNGYDTYKKQSVSLSNSIDEDTYNTVKSILETAQEKIYDIEKSLDDE